MDSFNRIKRDCASSEAQFNNRETGISCGPAAEFDESSFRLYGTNHDRFRDDYHSKWSANFHKDFMLENYFISLSRRLLNNLIINNNIYLKSNIQCT